MFFSRSSFSVSCLKWCRAVVLLKFVTLVETDVRNPSHQTKQNKELLSLFIVRFTFLCCVRIAFFLHCVRSRNYIIIVFVPYCYLAVFVTIWNAGKPIDVDLLLLKDVPRWSEGKQQSSLAPKCRNRGYNKRVFVWNMSQRARQMYNNVTC